MSSGLKSQVAREARTTHGQEMPTLKLARIVYRDNPKLFTSVEDARLSLRYIEGKTGKKNRNSVVRTAADFVVKEDRSKNPYNLPKSDETVYEPYVFKGMKRVGIMSDVHIPFHATPAITATIDYLKKIKPDGLLLNGDIIDCFRLSRYTKDPRKRDFKFELDSLGAFFDVLEKHLKCKIIYKLGNHENRYEQFLYEKAKELVGIEDFEFANIIKARQRGIEVIGDKTVMKLNSLNGIHGHEYIGGISAPVNVARGLYLRGKVSAFQGHNHSTSTHTESDMNGKVVTTYSIGCLGELHPAYMPLNKWNWGFADVDLDSNGIDYEFHNHTIYKGKVY